MLGGGEILGVEALPENLRRPRIVRDVEPDFPEDGLDLDATLDRMEQQYLRLALERTGGVQAKAAELLRMTFSQFRYKIQKHGLGRRAEKVELTIFARPLPWAVAA